MIAHARVLVDDARNDSAPAEGGTSTGAATALTRAAHGDGVPRHVIATYDGPQPRTRVRELVYVQVVTGALRHYVRNIEDAAVQSVMPSEAGDRVLIKDSAAPRAVNVAHALAAAKVLLVHQHAATVPRELLQAAMDEVARLTQQLATSRIRLAEATGLRDPHDPTNPPAPVAQES